MKLTRSSILRFLDDTKDILENPNEALLQLTSEELDSNERQYKIFCILKTFYLDNNKQDKIITFTISVFAFFISIFMKTRIDIDNESFSNNSSLNKNHNEFRFEYEFFHKKMIINLLFTNCLVLGWNIFLDFYSIYKKHKEITIKNYKPDYNWHLKNIFIKTNMRISFIISVLVCLVYCNIYYCQHKNFYFSENLPIILVLEFYFFISILRICYFFLKTSLSIFLMPVFIASYFIAIHEDKFIYYLNQVIKTEIKKTNIKVKEEEKFDEKFEIKIDFNKKNSITNKNTNEKQELIKNDYDIGRRSSQMITCAICLSDLIDGETISTLPCWNKHSFHTLCLEMWFESASVCPICRKDFNSLINDRSLINEFNRDFGEVELTERLIF